MGNNEPRADEEMNFVGGPIGRRRLRKPSASKNENQKNEAQKVRINEANTEAERLNQSPQKGEGKKS